MTDLYSPGEEIQNRIDGVAARAEAQARARAEKRAARWEEIWAMGPIQRAWWHARPVVGFIVGFYCLMLQNDQFVFTLWLVPLGIFLAYCAKPLSDPHSASDI